MNVGSLFDKRCVSVSAKQIWAVHIGNHNGESIQKLTLIGAYSAAFSLGIGWSLNRPAEEQHFTSFNTRMDNFTLFNSIQIYHAQISAKCKSSHNLYTQPYVYTFV